MRTTTTILAFAALMITAGNANAQKCESIKDPFTGTEKTLFIHAIGGVLVFKMELEPDGSAILYIRDAEPKIVETPIPEGSPFLILLEGGVTIELALMEDSKPSSGSISTSFQGTGSGMAYSEWIEKIKVPKEQIIALTQKKVTHLKYKRYDGSEFIFDCKQLKIYKMEKNLMAAAKCMAGKK